MKIGRHDSFAPSGVRSGGQPGRVQVRLHKELGGDTGCERLDQLPRDLLDVDLPTLDGLLERRPQSIGNLTQLRRLKLRNNSITQLPQSMGSMTNLTHLDLRANPLRTLPGTIGEIATLEKLDLRWCQLEGLPGWIHRLRERGVVVFC